MLQLTIVTSTILLTTAFRNESSLSNRGMKQQNVSTMSIEDKTTAIPRLECLCVSKTTSPLSMLQLTIVTRKMSRWKSAAEGENGEDKNEGRSGFGVTSLYWPRLRRIYWWRNLLFIWLWPVILHRDRASSSRCLLVQCSRLLPGHDDCGHRIASSSCIMCNNVFSFSPTYLL